jgi:hypothetical protein
MYLATIASFTSCDNTQGNSNNIIDVKEEGDSVLIDTTQNISSYSDTLTCKEYRVTYSEIPVLNAFRENVYIGSVMRRDYSCDGLSLYSGNQEYDSIEYGAIYGANFLFIKGTPSYKDTESLFLKVKDNTFFESNSFSTSSPIEFHNHKELYYLGMKICGLPMDSICGEGKYTNVEMQYKNGLFLPVENTLFSIIADFPENGFLFKDKSQKQNYSDLVYVNSISYGRKMYVIIESDYPVNKLKSIFYKLSRKHELNEEEKNIALNSVVWTVTLDKTLSPHTVNGNATLLSDLVAIMGKSEIIPVTFLFLA